MCKLLKQIVLFEVVVSAHYACPFGATASVHAWERIGHLIRWVARKLLKLAVLAYVDDAFAIERYKCLR